jgi:hypothetical protein
MAGTDPAWHVEVCGWVDHVHRLRSSMDYNWLGTDRTTRVLLTAATYSKHQSPTTAPRLQVTVSHNSPGRTTWLAQILPDTCCNVWVGGWVDYVHADSFFDGLQWPWWNCWRAMPAFLLQCRKRPSYQTFCKAAFLLELFPLEGTASVV